MLLAFLIFGGGLAYWYGLIADQRVMLITGATVLIMSLGVMLDYGGVEPIAIPFLAFLALLAFALKQVHHGFWWYVGWIVFIGVALALGLGVISFFKPVATLQTAEHLYRVPPEKIVLLLVLPPMVLVPWSIGKSERPPGHSWLVSLLILGAIAAILVPFALITGFVELGWAGQSAAYLAYWLAYNLIYTCVLEESFFRGIVQIAVIRAFKQRLAPTHAQLIGVAVASVLFGLAHFGGGATYVILATIAGIGFGAVYALTGQLHHAVIVHFSVNAINLLAFSKI